MLEDEFIKELDEFSLRYDNLIFNEGFISVNIHSSKMKRIEMIIEQFFTGYEIEIQQGLYSSRNGVSVKIFHTIKDFVKNIPEFPLGNSKNKRVRDKPRGTKFSVSSPCSDCGSYRRIIEYSTTCCYDCLGLTKGLSKTNITAPINQHNRKVKNLKNKVWHIPIVYGEKHTFKPS